MHPRVIEAVSAVMRDAYGNPSSQHAKGRAARALLDESRAVLADLSDAGVFLSASMACSSNHTTVPPGTWREKHPLALQLAGVPASLTRCTYRLSFSDRTTVAEVDRFLEELEEVVPADQVARST